MKTLQNNFTTPEQSKRLLELGVPADSADCYLYHWWNNGYRDGVYNIAPTPNKLWWEGHHNDRYTPVWSLGRLIEIELMCREDREGLLPRLSIVYGCASYIEDMILYMERRDHKYNFNQLED